MVIGFFSAASTLVPESGQSFFADDLLCATRGHRPTLRSRAMDGRGEVRRSDAMWPRAGNSSGASVIERTEDGAHLEPVLGVVWLGGG
jgi:hypothetical protein